MASLDTTQRQPSFLEDLLRALNGPGYSPIAPFPPEPKNTFDFGHAIRLVKRGTAIARLGWNGKGMYVGVHIPTEPTERPYLFMKAVDDTFVPWVASQSDLLATDWIVAP